MSKFLCMLGFHSCGVATRHSLDFDNKICDQLSRRISGYILVVKTCERCGQRIATKKNMNGYRSFNENWDIDVVDELVDRYERCRHRGDPEETVTSNHVK